MRLIIYFIACGALLVLFTMASSTFAAGLNPVEKAKLKEWQKAVDDPKGESAYYPKEMCGFTMKLKMDESIVKPFMAANNEAHFYCIAIRDKLSTICRNAKDNLSMGNHKDNKAYVEKLVKGKTIVCKAGKGTDSEATFESKGSEFIAYIGAKADVSEILYTHLLKDKNFNDGELPAGK